MIFYPDPRQKLLKAYNTANGQALTLADVEFKDVRPVRTIVPKPNTVANTAVTMSVERRGNLSGETTLYYDRLSLVTAFKYAPLENELAVHVTTEKTIHELLPVINQRLGTELRPDDIVDTPINLEWGIDTITLKATPESMIFTDSIKLGLRASPLVVEMMNVDYKPQIHQTANEYTENANGALTAKYNPGQKTFMYDYTAVADVLKVQVAFPGVWATGNANNNLAACTALANALKSIDGIQWVAATGLANFNLYGHWVLFNGKTEDAVGTAVTSYRTNYEPELVSLLATANTEYDNVIVIMSDNPWHSKHGWRDTIICHYND